MFIFGSKKKKFKAASSLKINNFKFKKVYNFFY